MVTVRLVSFRQTFLMRLTKTCLRSAWMTPVKRCVFVCLNMFLTQRWNYSENVHFSTAFLANYPPKKILQKTKSIKSGGLFLNLHLPPCLMRQPQEMHLLMIWQVWHLQINLWGVCEKAQTHFAPQKLWWNSRRHHWSSPTASFLATSVFACRFPSCHFTGCAILTFGLTDWSLSTQTSCWSWAAGNKVLITCFIFRARFARWFTLHLTRLLLWGNITLKKKRILLNKVVHT